MSEKAKLKDLAGITIYKSFSEMFRDISSKLEKRHYAAHAKLKKKTADGYRRKG
jgi:ppGpp synthetase/RelA/SpoT-type nucleotidyltranferase